MRNHRIRRTERVQVAAPPGPRAPRVPGLRLGRDRAARGGRARLRPRGRQSPEPEDRGGPEWIDLDARPRPHALGDPRQRHRGERAPADGLRRPQALDRPERDRRELPRADPRPEGRGPRVLLRDGRRDRLPPDRAPLRGRPRRGRPEGVQRARRALLLRRDSPRPSRPARRSALPDAARRRSRGGRDVPRLERHRLPARDAHRPVPRRRRRRRALARRRSLPARRRRYPGRAPARRARLGRRGRREGRLRDVHAQGDLRAARGRRRDDRRSRPPRQARARGPRALGRGGAQPAPDRPARVRHRLPLVRRRPVRARGVGAAAGRARHRLGVDLPQSGDRPRHPRDRRLPVGRDARHDRGDEAREEEGRPYARDHEHDGLADHARGRVGALHALRARGQRRRVEDVHGADRALLSRGAEDGTGAGNDGSGRARLHPRPGLRAARRR